MNDMIDKRGRLRKFSKAPLNTIDRRNFRGTEIRKLREKYNLTQKRFSEIIGISSGEISNLETELRFSSVSVLILLNILEQKGIGVFLK